MGWLVDLDGVVWLGDQPIAGAAQAVAELRAAGERVLFCTNLSRSPVAELEAKLARHGIPAAGDVVSSAMAAARLVEPGERVLVCAGPGVTEALEQRGALPVREGPAESVVVGLHLDFDYDRLREACAAVFGGARLIGTNDDPTYPSPGGLLPGAGALVAAVERATGTVAVLAGKPHPPMVDLVGGLLEGTGTVVGDRHDTDGLLAARLGYRFLLVLSGSTGEDDPGTALADGVSPDLAHAVRAHLAGT